MAPSYGRFVAPDPLGLVGGGANPYPWVLGNPTNLVDPLGLSPFECPICEEIGAALAALGSFLWEHRWGIVQLVVVGSCLAIPGACTLASGLYFGVKELALLSSENWRLSGEFWANSAWNLVETLLLAGSGGLAHGLYAANGVRVSQLGAGVLRQWPSALCAGWEACSSPYRPWASG